ncbi:unnamed protein product [Rotaria sp. Silwood2]|nr:unnamed protein product [Rotaria sp. Silwood2]CAF3421883.1 unnamed protein product [Rotaria sp. Silwood2]
MASNSETDSDVTETFTNVESDESDNDSVSNSYKGSGSGEEEEQDNESDNEEEQDNHSDSEEEQDMAESLNERRRRVDRSKPKQFLFDSSESGISSNVKQIDENSALEYFRLIFDDNLMQIIVEETNRYHLYKMKHENLPKRYHEAICATIPEMYKFFAVYMLMAHTKKS